MHFKKLLKFFLYSEHSLVVFLLFFTQLIITSFTQVLTKTNAYNDMDKVRYALIAFSFALIFGAIIKVYSFHSFSKLLKTEKKNESLLDYATSRFVDWTVVEIRVQIRVLLRMFLFFIPGIVEAIRLSLAVPYVFLDERMKDLTFDPVLESRKQIAFKSPYFWPLFLVTIVIPVTVAVLLKSDKVVFETYETLFFGVFTAIIQTLTVCIYYSYIVNIFIEKNQRNT